MKNTELTNIGVHILSPRLLGLNTWKKSVKTVQRVIVKMGRKMKVARRNRLLSLWNGHKCEVYTRFY